MNPNAPKLFSELNWDGLQLKNRVAMSPMTRGRAGEEMTANALMARYYAQRATAGVIITEGTFISPAAVGWLHAPGIGTDARGEAWAPVVEAVHQHDTPFFLQLWHCGLADLVAFGRPFISNPDLVDRFGNDWKLNETAPQAVWYSPGADGYTDFPTFAESN